MPVFRTALVDLPFSSSRRPNIAFSILKACLESHGYSCTVLYAKLDFAAEIGLDRYEFIAEGVRQELLLGDYIFSELLGSCEISRRADMHVLDADFCESVSPIDVLALRDIRHRATNFLFRVAKQIVSGGYQLVGLNATFQIAPAVALARLLKRSPSAPAVVLGGSHCDGEPGLSLHSWIPQLDFICRGEGETLFPQLVRAHSESSGAAAAGTSRPRRQSQVSIFPILDKGHGAVPGGASTLKDIEGLVWRAPDGRSIANGERTRVIENLDEAPAPDYSDYVAALSSSKLNLGPQDVSFPFESSRGCWFGEKMHCTFCGLNGQTMRFRRKSVERTLKELNAIASTGAKRADAVDLILDVRAFDSLLPAIAAQPTGLSLFYEIKSNLKREQVFQLSAAGVCAVQPGIESLSTPTLTLMRKGVAAYQNIRLLKWLAEAGISALWNLLYGFPFEDADEYRRMAGVVPLLTHLQPPSAPLNRVLLNRFSPLFDRCGELGVINIRPVPAYQRAFGGCCSNSSGFAYYYDFDHIDARASFDYVEPLRVATRQWIREFGTAALVSVRRQGHLRVFDSRAARSCDAVVLEGEDCAAYEACDEGASLRSIREKTGIDTGRLHSFIDRGLDEKWLLDIDGRYVTLPISMSVPESVPDSLVGAVSLALYRARTERFIRGASGMPVDTA
jgi:ribosomal peptide maturation radical SAM protein 1